MLWAAYQHTGGFLGKIGGETVTVFCRKDRETGWLSGCDGGALQSCDVQMHLAAISATITHA
jgi:hypothetical protein